MEKINLIRVGSRLGEVFYTGAIKAKVLLDNCKYPTYKPNEGIILGYQRKQKDVNVNSVSERTYRNTKDFDSFIDNVNVNIRDEKVHTAFVKPLDPKSTDDGSIYIFEYEPDSLLKPELWTVDGQTRVKGLAKARAEADISNDYKKINEIDEKLIGINLTFTTDIYKECFFFYLLNHYSTNIPPEGALRMMYDGWKKGKVTFVNEITDNPRAKTKLNDVRAMEVTEDLNANSNIWAGYISDFNENNRAHKISIKAMTNILKPLLEVMDKYKQEPETKTNKTAQELTFEIFDAYWGGLALWADFMFDDKTRYEYGIMKSSQSEVLTKVLIEIFKEHRSWEKLGTKIGSLTSPKTYHDLVKVAFDEKNLKQTSGAGGDVRGADCWRVGKAGSMGSITNSAAKRDMKDVLFRLIKAELKKNNPSLI